jgi:hypothetical protein
MMQTSISIFDFTLLNFLKAALFDRAADEVLSEANKARETGRRIESLAN